MPALYRVRQFMHAVAAELSGARVTAPEISQVLDPGGVALFGAMPRYDRRHGACVMRTLLQQGYHDRDLLSAALLHDVGKTASQEGRLGLRHRVLMVLVRAVAPGMVERLGTEGGGAWRRVFFVQRHHADLGAELALASGCSQVTAALIGRHEQAPAPGDDPRLTALRAADAAN
ncbi:MAG TPA: HDIG domain-containing protein [Anaerolineae bacterium]|nr:HDIG domain-containing protein [Anaerolineae bacterium]